MIRIGIDYYPEHWDRALWDDDVARMAELGVHVVRIAEFAWSRLEPADGEFDFAWLDEAVELIAAHGMQVILGTPTNCAPRWLYQEHPDCVQWGRDGRPVALGIRGHRCQTSATFRAYAERIVRKMAERYAGRPEVAGWQIDNEVERNVCSCPSCTAAFRAYLQKKHGDLEALNKAWGADVWSGDISDWDQVQMPVGEAYDYNWFNPAYLLDWYRFSALSTSEYVAFQAGIIREYDPAAVITTNTCLSELQPDFHQEFRALDVASYDNYPPSELPSDPEAIHSNAFTLDFVRGFKRKDFWILEELGGETGCWMPVKRALEPGMLEGYALQAVAHGADLVSFFRWRTAKSGAEMFCHGILNHDNRPNRRYRELAALCERLRALPGLDRTAPVSEVALLYSSEQEFSLKTQRMSESFSYWRQMQLLHGGALGLGVNVDVIHESASLEAYKVVLIPCHFVADPELAARLEDFARRGGTVVVTERSGVKDQDGNCLVGEPLPVYLRELCGCSVAEYDAIGPCAQQVRSAVGKEYDITDWCDLLNLEGAEAWASYEGRFYDGVPAVARHDFGAGEAYYLGTVGCKELYRDLMREICNRQGIPMVEGLPSGMECCERTGEGGTYRFFFNNTLQPASARIGTESVEFAPMEVKVLVNDHEWG